MNRSKCDTIRPLISAALDGDLDEGEFVQLSEHLAVCSECRQVHQDYVHLRDGLHSSARPAPPPDLATNVWKETVEKPPPPAIIRLASRTGVRLGMSTMAASVVALLVVALFLAHGYDQRSVPQVASSQPEQNPTLEWSISHPIEIEFSKQMDRESVEENVIIWPSSEQDRLPTSWSGNTFIIGRSEEQSVLLRPETDYRITILEHARDRHGNPVGDFWVLEFRTGQPDVAIATPSPNSDRTDDSVEEEETFSSDWMFGLGADLADEDIEEDERAEPDQSAEPVERDEDEPEQGEEQPVEPEQVEPEPTASPNQDAGSDDSAEGNPEPTAEPEPTELDPTAEPEPTQPDPTTEPEPTQPQPTPEPEPSATSRPDPTPESTPTPSPDPTPTAEPHAVRGAFGEVYWGNSSVQSALGEPVQQAQSFIAAEQEFQRGLMFRQFYQDRNAIFVFVNGSGVRMYNNEYDPDLHSYPVEEKEEGLYQPGGYFGMIWTNRGSVAEDIGYAVSSGPVENVDAAIQQFDGGTLLYSRGSVYVIHADGSWDVFSVRADSNGGFQRDDPEPESDQGDDSEQSEPEAAPEDETEYQDNGDPEGESESGESDTEDEDGDEES